MNNKLLAGTAFLSLALATCATTQTKDNDREMLERSRPNVYRMLIPENQESGGTGFTVWAGKKRVLITNAHVCDGTQGSYLVAEQDGRRQQVAIVNKSAEFDICRLQAPDGDDALTLGPDTDEYERVFIVGHPFLNPITITKGFLNSEEDIQVSYCHVFADGVPRVLNDGEDESASSCVKTRHAFGSDARSAPGNSGSPVLNASGSVLGILFAGSPRGQSYIIPGRDLASYLKRMR